MSSWIRASPSRHSGPRSPRQSIERVAVSVVCVRGGLACARAESFHKSHDTAGVPIYMRSRVILEGLSAKTMARYLYQSVKHVDRCFFSI